MEFKDYYKTLGVARTAAADEIKKAFRKLAREHHPDVAKDKKRAEEKFKEINEAYEVLGDPEKRRKYDELGSGWKAGSEYRPPPGYGGFGRGAGRGAGASDGFEFQFGGTGFSDFFESRDNPCQSVHANAFGLVFTSWFAHASPLARIAVAHWRFS